MCQMGPLVFLVVRNTFWLILHGRTDCGNWTLGTQVEAGVSMSVAGAG